MDNRTRSGPDPETLLGMPRHRQDLASTRVRLRPHARPLRRGETEVQFGLDPDHGIVISGLCDAEIGWLLTLGAPVSGSWGSGSLSHASGAAVSLSGVLLGSASQWGLSTTRAAELFGVLQTHNLVIAEGEQAGASIQPASASRRGSPDTRLPHVCVLGHGTASDVIRDALRPMEPAIGFRLGHDPPGTPADPSCDLALLVTGSVLSAVAAAPWAEVVGAYLPVLVESHRVVLGPLVAGPDGPCLRCLDLHRRDRDRAWPLIMAQLGTANVEWSAPVAIDPALAGTTAGLCAMLTRSYLCGDYVPMGVTWALTLPWPHLTTRRWVRHPACSHEVEVDRAGGPEHRCSC